MANVVIAITSSGTWRVPADCNNIQIEVIGHGGVPDGNGTSGGGGAYTKLTSLAVTPLQTLTASTGSGNGFPAWLSTTGSAPLNTSQGALADSGGPGFEGLASACIPSAGAFSGGAGIGGGGTTGGDTIAGGGGAAGPNGAGKNGGNYSGTNPGAGGGGGGANGGSSTVGGDAVSDFFAGAGGAGRGGSGGGTAGSLSAGGNATAGSGGGGGGGATGFPAGGGAQDNVWTDYAGNVYGPGGGGGGGGGGYGEQNVTSTGYGGGNTGKSGLIIITYTPVAITGGPYTEAFTLSDGATAAIPWRVPLGVTSVQVEAIGGSGVPLNAISGRGAGGGAYAKTTSLTVTPEDIAYIRPAPRVIPPVYGTAVDSWFNRNANSAPGSTSAGVLAAGGASGLGGTAANSIGVDLKYSGGNGGLNNTTASGAKFRGGGGGGAAGPSGAGKAGGNGWPSGTGSGTGGGGGGSNGGSSSAGQAAPSATVGGAGGNGTGGTGGGAGGTASANAVSGAAGTGAGGGGGSASATAFRYDGALGATSTVWTVNGVTYGPGGGGGGAGCTTTTTGQGRSGGTYGGGGGAGISSGAANQSQGLVIITYSAVAPTFLVSARLFSTGTLAIANTMQFDEITQNTASIQSTVVYSSLFDEVSQSAVAMRILSNGSIQVSNIIDEVTGIA